MILQQMRYIEKLSIEHDEKTSLYIFTNMQLMLMLLHFIILTSQNVAVIYSLSKFILPLHLSRFNSTRTSSIAMSPYGP